MVYSSLSFARSSHYMQTNFTASLLVLSGKVESLFPEISKNPLKKKESLKADYSLILQNPYPSPNLLNVYPKA
jgi:hypothetical protein